MENPRTDPRDYDDDGGLKRTGEEAAGDVRVAIVVAANRLILWCCRHGMDGHCTHHHGRDRVWRPGAAVGIGAARLGDLPDHGAALRRHHLLHLRAALGLLPIRRPEPRRAQLHIH